MSKRNHTPMLPDPDSALPLRFCWEIVRVIHCMPDDQVDGYRVTLQLDRCPLVEVIHRDVALAQSLALDAGKEIYPDLLKGVKG